MLEIKKSSLNLEYKRSIESMGKGLLLFKVYVKEKHNGQNYHMFYENGKKPPFDIAINPEKGNIEYISFFLQDEKLNQKELDIEILFTEHNITITDTKFSEQSCDITKRNDFSVFLDNNSVIAVRQGVNGRLTGYRLNESNYLLLDMKKEIVGIILKNIMSNEMDQMKESDVITGKEVGLRSL